MLLPERRLRLCYCSELGFGAGVEVLGGVLLGKCAHQKHRQCDQGVN